MKKIPEKVSWIYHTICDHSPDGIVVFNTNGIILHANKTAERMLRYPETALVGMDFQNLLVGDKEKAWLTDFTKGKSTKLTLTDISLKSGDGSILHADVSFVNIREGETRLGTVFIRDTSPQQRLTLEKEKSEKLLSDVFSAIEDGISILYRDFTIIRTNKWLENQYRHKLPIVGKKCYEVYQDRSSSCPDCPAVLAIQTGKSQHAFVPYKSETNPMAWRNLYAYPIKDADGNVLGVVEYIRDVTQEVELERKLSENERRFRQFFENIPIFSYFTTRNGNFLDVNAAGATLLGYTKEELLKKRVSDCYAYPSERLRFIETIERDGYVKEYPALLKKKNGESIYCRITATLIRDQNGKIIGYQGFIRDVTKEERLKKEVNIFATLLTQTNAVVVITNPDGTILFVNKAFEKATGYTTDEVVGKTPRILKSGRHDDAFYKNLWETITSGKSWHGRFYNRKKDGSFYHEDAYIFPILNDEGKIINFAAIKRDISREMELEEQAKQTAKLEAIGQLVGGIAHDFNNVLTSIQGFTELGLSKLSPGDSIYGELSWIHTAAGQATRITRQLLGFSRRQIITPRSCSLNRIVKDMEPLLNRYIGEDIELSIKLTNEKDVIMADRGQIEQCILNLVLNARDAIREIKENHYPRLITIETLPVVIDDNATEKSTGVLKGKYILLSVSDTGVGMDKDTLKKIFEPFFTTKPEGLGTGLGCSTVFGIVKQNKGSVTATSELGVGTTIKIYWPATDNPLPKEEPKIAVPYTSPQDPEGKTILVVEDNEGIRDFVTQALKMVGYRVYDAEDGQQALEIVEEENINPDLLFTDAIMPRMSGKEIAEILEQRFPGLKILFSSGYTETQIFEDGFLKSHYAFIHKPYGLHKLLETVYMVLERETSE